MNKLAGTRAFPFGKKMGFFRKALGTRLRDKAPRAQARVNVVFCRALDHAFSNGSNHRVRSSLIKEKPLETDYIEPQE